jgi:hypothetical protein
MGFGERVRRLNYNEKDKNYNFSSIYSKLKNDLAEQDQFGEDSGLQSNLVSE